MIYKLSIPDMMCGHCEKRITEAVEAAGGKVEEVNIEAHTIKINTDLSADRIIVLIDDAGYSAKVIE